jgi:hypothetical protein
MVQERADLVLQIFSFGLENHFEAGFSRAKVYDVFRLP